MKRLTTLGTLAVGAGIGLGLGLHPAPAFADTGNLLACLDLGFALQQCQLRDVKLADGIVEAGLSYEAQFLVQYDFPCSGHAVQLGLRTTSSGSVGPSFKMGVRNGLIMVNGMGELHPDDPLPEVTRTLTFLPGCSLNIKPVTMLPSTSTVQIWTNQAESEARILDLSTNLYLLAKDFQNLSTWNVDKLNLLKTKLETLVASTPTNLNYRVMLNSINSALQNQPPSATLDELRRAGDDVIATLRGELVREIAVAQALVDRFTRWQLVANQALARALGNASNA